MSARVVGWSAAVLAMLVTVALIVGEITNARQRRWWSAHALTTSTVSGLLVLLITILVVNQLLNLRQARQRSHAVAAQAAIVVGQANQSARDVSSVGSGSADQGAASDSLRTYIMVLLISSPVFISDPVARRFLEQAQNLGGVMAHRLKLISTTTAGASVPIDGLDDAMKQLQAAAAPLLQLLSPGVRDSILRTGQTPEE